MNFLVGYLKGFMELHKNTGGVGMGDGGRPWYTQLPKAEFCPFVLSSLALIFPGVTSRGDWGCMYTVSECEL